MDGSSIEVLWFVGTVDLLAVDSGHEDCANDVDLMPGGTANFLRGQSVSRFMAVAMDARARSSAVVRSVRNGSVPAWIGRESDEDRGTGVRGAASHLAVRPISIGRSLARRNYLDADIRVRLGAECTLSTMSGAFGKGLNGLFIAVLNDKMV